MVQAFRIAWYRYRATFTRRVTGYLSVVLLIGLLGGVGMAALAGARRTQSSYPRFLASTNASDLTMAVYQVGPSAGKSRSLKSTIERLPGVKHVVSASTPPIAVLGANGAARVNALSNVNIAGSLDDMTITQDRLAVVSGRAAVQSRANEIVMTAGAAKALGVRLGQIVPLGVFTQAQMYQPDFGTPRDKPLMLVRSRLVGIVDLNTEVVQDDVDQTFGMILVDRALMRQMYKKVPGSLTPVLYGIQLDHPDAQIATVEKELIGIVPRGYTYEFHVTSSVTSQVELAIKPESVALGAFGAIAALVCLVLASQAISRLLRRGDEDRRIMRAFGSSPLAAVLEGLLGVLFAVVLGAVLAFAVATVLSPLGPLGPVRPIYPGARFAVDATVLGGGVLVLICVLGAVAVKQSLRGAPHRRRLAGRASGARAKVTRGVFTAVLPVTGSIGVDFALQPGQGRTAVPARSVLFGTVIAVAMVVTTLTFASGLSNLISHPPLYGWNWNYLLEPTDNVPPAAISLLNHDPKIASWSGAAYTDLEIDGQEVPVLVQHVHAKVAPPILSGHGLDGNNQIVLGAGTLQMLHKHVGDTVEVSLGTKKHAPAYIKPTPLVIVGTATLPAVGYNSYVAEHTSMGTGAILPRAVFPAPFGSFGSDPNLNGPELVFVRMRQGVSAAAGRADLQRIANVADQVFAHDKNTIGDDVAVLGVLRPVQIVNYRSIGSTPIVLAVGLAFGSILALGLTLASSVRRRRRDLALLKMFGFTRRQLAATVAWQSTTTALVGAVLGIPLGIVIGRELWTLFARSINAVPEPSVPVLSVFLVGLGTLVFANLVAALPGRSAARTSTALVLRSE
jgi:FtsX-like permease family